MRLRLLVVILGTLTVGPVSVSFGQPTRAAVGNAGTASVPADAAVVSAAVDGGVSASTATATTAPVADAGGMTGEQYVVRLRDLEQRINELKEEIFRSKARLSLLAESVLQNVVGGARAIIQHQNEMGPSFRLVRAVYALDGAPILTRTDDNGSLADQRNFPVYNGQIGAGDHTLTVNLEYQGHGYGIFSYVKGYTFRVRSTQSFSVPEGKAIQIRVVGYEKGGPTTAPEERPAVRYIQRIMSLREVQDTEGSSATAGTSGGTGSQTQQGGAGNNP